MCNSIGGIYVSQKDACGLKKGKNVDMYADIVRMDL